MRFVLPVILFALLAPSAHAYPKLPNPLPPVKHNPADALVDSPIENFVYDRATKCKNRRNAGITALATWLGDNTRGVFWGSYRCEKWGKRSASLHAENRAIDWHLDALQRADRRAADKLFRLLLAPDRLGNPQALARRMGVEELIWDCGYWGIGMTEFRPYSVCYKRNGKRRKRFDRTAAHQDHIHIGMTKRGAKGLTSFWTAR
ncbi:MAG TPA: hypothetical protein VFM58_20410 [Solirubrobacteraceae bacterium]|nr:hypothetical protein [Solirubrobacteraceae bacterium]